MKSSFKKVVLLAHQRQYKQVTEGLQELGVVHLENLESQSGTEVDRVRQQIADLDRAISVLKKSEDVATKRSKEPVSIIVEKVKNMEAQVTELNQKIDASQKELEQLSAWGDYSYLKFKPLIDLGYRVFLASCNRDDFADLDLSGMTYQILREDKSKIYWILFSKGEAPDLSVDLFNLPENDPESIRQRINEIKHKATEVVKNLGNYTPFLPDLEYERAKASDQLQLTKANQGYEQIHDRLLTISGWCPEQKIEMLRVFLENSKVAFLIRDPQRHEDVPVRLKNPFYTKYFEPITGIFELPSYHEVDLTPFTAVFYPILFAYCLGDAGYGFVLTVGMLTGYFTFLRSQPGIAILGSILGVVTMIMGLIKSGSLFGIPLLPDNQQPWIEFLSQFVLIPDDSNVFFNAFNVALLIGVIQILTGLIVSVYSRLKYDGPVYALNPLGKLFIVVSLLWLFMANMQNISALQSPPVYPYTLLIAGIILVALFHEMEIKMSKRIINSFMPLFFIFTGILGDILSYVRLFALGLASSVLGLVVNQIAGQIMSGGLVSVAGGILFLLFGHTLNFGIAALGSFVHPLRLTFVEFYQNANFQGKGIPYKPFQKSIKTANNP